jgi:hypothetical protein
MQYATTGMYASRHIRRPHKDRRAAVDEVVDDDLLEGVIMPVAWTRRWAVPEIQRRGMLWAAR